MKYLKIVLLLLISVSCQAQSDQVDLPIGIQRSATAAASITNSYVTVLTNSNSKQLSLCRFRNSTDNPVSVNLTGSGNEDIPFIAAGATELYNFRTNKRYFSGSIAIKYSSSATTTGGFYITCFQ